MGSRLTIRRKSTLILQLSLLLLTAAPARALDPSKAITQYLQTVWNTSSGLPQSSVHAMAQTTDGYMWLGTEEGLARFDGVRFTIFTRRSTPAVASDYIQSLAADPDGSLWIGTDSGLSHFRPGAEQGRHPAFALLNQSSGLSGNRITALREDRQGDLWVATDRGLNRIHHGHIETWTTASGLPDSAINSLAVDSAGALWIATDKGLARLAEGRLTTFTTRDGLPSNTVTALGAAPDGSLWIATLARHIARFQAGRITVDPVPLPANEITGLHSDRDGVLWIAFDHRGIGRLSRGVLSLYGQSQGLPSNRCAGSVFEDREGSLWFGMLDAGVVQLRDGKFTVFGTPEGLSADYIDGVLQAQDGSMWIAADTGGLNHLLPDGQIEIWGPKRGLPSQELFTMLQTRDGSLWAGYKRGTLARIRNGQVSVFHDPAAPDGNLLSLFEDREGQLWIGRGGKGLARFRNGRFETVIPSGIVRDIAQAPDGALWLALDGDGIERISHGVTTLFSHAQGLPDNHVLCLTPDTDGTIWVGTPGGLSRIRGAHITTWTADQGLPDSAVGSILLDRHGNLWIGGDSGIVRVDRAAVSGPAAGPLHPVVYSTADGLRTQETVYGITPSSWRDRSGRLWFPTIVGVAVIDPAHIPANTVVPPVWIENASFNNRPIALSDNPRLGPGAGSLDIQFTAPTFVAPQQARFRYRLAGFDSDWIYTSARVSRYTNLPPGPYTFQVQTENSDGVWNRSGASFSFTVRPRPAQTPWAYLCYIALALLVTWAIIALRTRSLLRRQAELKQIVAERTAQLESEKAALEAARHKLHIQATHDSLTGLFNRAAILDHLQRELSRAARESRPLTVVIADLDHFKSLNDNYGHLCGDDAIREAAQRFRSVMRDYDLAGRYGGEEFLMLLPGLDPLHAPERIQELLDAIGLRPFLLGHAELHLTCSLGVATVEPGTETPTVREILSRADNALYEAKRAGRNRFAFDLCIHP